MPEAIRSRYRRTSLTCPTAMTTVPGSQTSARALMSFSGSPLSDRSTMRMFGLAVIESDWIALRRPPRWHFSGAQPMSTTTGRRTSSAVSSHMKAAKASRLAFFQLMSVSSTAARGIGRRIVLQAIFAGWLGGAEAVDGLGSAHHHRFPGAVGALHEVFLVGDHRGEIAVDGAAEVRRRPVAHREVGLGRPVGAARYRGSGAGHDDARTASRNITGGNRGGAFDEHAPATGDRIDRRDRGLRLQGIVYRDLVTILEAKAFEPPG